MQGGQAKVTLRTNLGNHPAFRPILSGEICSPLISFDFCGPEPPNRGFKPTVREAAFDLGELAIGTFLQAHAYGKPLALLPITVMARFQHNFLEHSAAQGRLSPKDLEGRRIGVRAYTQTTGIWLRGILEQDFDLDLDRLTWVCTDDPHLSEYTDPDNVVRVARPSDAIGRMLIDGEIDAAIVNGELSKHPSIEPLFPDPEAEALRWHARHGYVPVNHLLVMSAPLAAERPEIVRELFRMFVESKRRAAPPDGLDFLPMGVEPLRPALEAMAEFAWRQRIVPRRIAVDELFDATAHALTA